MRKLILAFAIFLVNALWSCDSNHSRLCEIDEIMETDPEKALTELEQLSRSGISHRDSAYFALIYTQAQARCCIMVDSDSLISIAYNQYSLCNSDNLRTRAHFYNAKVAFNKGDLKTAMKDVVVAYDIAKRDRNPLWIARTSELISDIYFESFNYLQSEIYEYEAIENYLLANKIENHRYALTDIATIFINENKYNEALSIVDSLLEVVNKEEPIDSALIDYIAIPRNAALYYSNRLKELEEQIGPINLRPENVVRLDEFIIQSDILNKTEGFDSASVLLSVLYGLTGNERDKAWIKFTSYQQSMESGNYKKAALMADSVLQIQNKMVKELVQESVGGVMRDFYSAKAEYQQQRSKFMFYLLIGVIIVALIITALLIGMYRLKMRAKKAELEANLSELMRIQERAERIDTEYRRVSSRLSEQSSTLESLQKRLESNERDEKETSEIIERLFREKWQTLNMLCNDYFELGDSDQSRATILNNIKQELKKLRSKKSLKEIETAVDRYMGGIMTLMRQECDFLKDDNFTFLALIYAGFSVRTICTLMDIKYKLFYLRKSRLAKRIADSDAPHKGLFLSKLGI